MGRIRVAACCGGLLLLGACTGAQVVTGDSRGFFDTSKGMYGGNEFNARSVEGKITVAHEQAPQQAAGGAPPAGAPAAAPVAAAAPSPAAAPAPAAVAPPLSIDANAYAAVFGAMQPPVRPTDEQLMRLDSLALIASDAARVDLQTKILACRRAAQSCRLAPQ
jgi:hypothetical protein